MTDLLTAHHRLIYSLMKPVARAAARFEVSIALLGDLLRVAYFEVLLHEYGLSMSEIARRFGQTERHMRTLARRLQGDFYSPEREVGLVREVERSIAAANPTRAQLRKQLQVWPAGEIEAAVDQLLREDRIVDDGARLSTSKRYVVFRSDSFPRRIDALNHFLGGAYQAILQRLIFDNKRTAMIKTMTFAARPEDLQSYVARLEGDLRRELAALEEQAHFDGRADQQFTLSITLAPVEHRGEEGDEPND